MVLLLPQRRRRRRRREKSSLPPLLFFVPANSHLRNEEGNCGEQEEGEEETRKGKSPRVLPLFRSVLESGAAEISLVHFTHQLFHLTEFQVRPSWSPTFALLLPTVDRPPAELVTSFRPRQKHKGRLRCGARREGGGELKTGSREGEGQKSEVISLPR